MRIKICTLLKIHFYKIHIPFIIRIIKPLNAILSLKRAFEFSQIANMLLFVLLKDNCNLTMFDLKFLNIVKL